MIDEKRADPIEDHAEKDNDDGEDPPSLTSLTVEA